MQGTPWKLARSPLSPPVMSPVGSGLGAQSGGGGGGGSGLAIPTELRSLLFHDDGTATKYPAYYTEEEWAGHGHLLKDYSLGVGDLREKRLGFCYDFDGVDDYVEFPNIGSLASVTLEITFEYSASEYQIFNLTTDSRYLAATINSSRFGNVDFVVSSGILPLADEVHFGKSGGFVVGQLYRLVVTTDAGANVSSATIDGEPLMVTTGRSRVDTDNRPQHRIGRRVVGIYVYAGKLSDYRVSGLGHWPLQEESGNIAYDISGNGNHGTIHNAVTSGAGAIHQVDTGVVTSYPNDAGYRVSGETIIPAVSETTAADGNPLTVVGRCPQYGLAKGLAWQGDQNTVYVDLGTRVLPVAEDFVLETWFRYPTPFVSRVLFAQGVDFSSSYSYISLQNTGRVFARIRGLQATTVGSYGDQQWHRLRLAVSGSAMALTVDDETVAGSGTLVNNTDSGGVLLARFDGQVKVQASLGAIEVSSEGVTTMFSPIAGTRHVAVTRSDGSDALVIDAVKNGALETLYVEGNGAWRLPEIENGAHFDGTALYPAASGAEVAVNRNAVNIPANKHPIGLLVDRTGGVAAPFDNVSGTSNYTDEAFNDIPTESTLNKRGLSIYAADRYGAALEDIQS